MRLSARPGRLACKLHRREVSAPGEPAIFHKLNEIFARCGGCSILGGIDGVIADTRYSYWTAESLHTFEIRSGCPDPFADLEAELLKYSCPSASPDDTDSPFVGGWIGYFSYDLGRHIEHIPAIASDDMQMPLVRLSFYDRALAFDSARRCFIMFTVQINGDDVERKFAWLKDRLKEAAEVEFSPPSKDALERIDPSALVSNISRDEYFAALERIRRHIYDGDIYQINLSQRFERPFSGRPIDLFQWFCAHNPCPHAAFIAADSFSVVSSSMELFIGIAGQDIITRPIKGTRRRLIGSGPEIEAANAAAARELLASPKERAELNMIIDLERNDLGRVCRYGSISVREPRHIRAYPTVFHALATVGGTLRAETTFPDLLRAMFPGGSITGAPKIRAMEIIEELEPSRRGLYTGSIGYIGLDGNVCLNIAIRTIIIGDNRAWAQTGGGIVADSVPAEEYVETLTKARALAAALEAAQSAAHP